MYRALRDTSPSGHVNKWQHLLIKMYRLYNSSINQENNYTPAVYRGV
jgi:hypothetical protein